MSPSIVSGERLLGLETLHSRAARAATGLASLGVGEDDSVALLLRNDIPFLEASLACARLGAYGVPINWHNTGEELAYILADCEAKVLVAHADLIAPLHAAVPPATKLLVAATPPHVLSAYGLPPEAGAPAPGEEDWGGWLEGFSPIATEPPLSRSSMIYTSGTTGRPKGVRRWPLSPDLEAKFQQSVRDVMGVREGMRTVITGPLYHSAPNAFGLSAVRHNATVVLQPRFDPETLLALIERHRITHLHMVPTMFVRLLRLPESVRTRHDLSSLEWVIHGAAPCPVEVKRAMIQWWGPLIHEYYGSTETAINATVSSQEWLKRPGTVGRPIPGVSIQILDEDGRNLPSGTPGQVFIRQSLLPDFTYHRLDEKRREIQRGGHVSVGDIGTLDPEGFLFLCDRRVDMVISGGVNIYPAEIEAVLVGLPGVNDCAVFGIPDEEFGESLLAVVEPRDGAQPDPEALQAELRRHLAGYKVPRRIEFQADLPREDSGKIFKRRLRDPYWRDAGRSI